MLSLIPRKVRAILKWCIGFGILSVFLLHGLDVAPINIVKKIDGFSQDLRLKSTLKYGVDERIVIVDIDEASLTQLGQWPWNRHHLSDLVTALFDHYQVRALGFDMVFAEPASPNIKKILNDIERLPNISKQTKQALQFEAQQDEHFANALKNKAISSGVFFLQTNDTQLNTLPEPIANVDTDTHQALFLPKPIGYTANLNLLQNATASSGFFDNPTVDDDGVFRRVPLLQSFHGQLYPSLALSVARLALDNAPLDIQLVQQDQWLAIEAVQLGHRIIPTDKTGSVTIPFRGPEGSFPYLSAWEVIQKKVDAPMLKDKIILLGTSAPGLLDLRSTPVDESMPGVEVHANIIAGILDGAIPHAPAYQLGAMFMVYLIIGVILTVAPHFLSALNTLLLCGFLASLWLGLNFYLWESHLIFPLAGPIIMIISFFMFHTFWGFFVESRKKRAITNLFGQYVPPELVNEMAAQPEKVSITGQNKHLSVLFSDVRNFTSISESLEPSELSTLMNDILSPLTHTIYQHRGTVDKYMGDAIMAFWGAPLDEPQHAHQAIACALDMQQDIKKVSGELQQKGLPHIAMGIGINTGNMNVGNMGSIYRMAYTVLGDSVNLGSRLEGLSKNYGADIVVSETTKNEAPDFLYLPLDRVQVKGKEEPVNIFQPLCYLENATEAQLEAVQLMQNMMLAYVDQLWAECSLYLNKIRTLELDELNTLMDVYHERFIQFSQSPPEANWNGVFKHTSK